MLYDEMGRLADEAFRLNARIAQNAMLLTVAMNYAWTASRQPEVRRTGSEIKVPAKRSGRSSRSKRRGALSRLATQDRHDL
jgi:hypothetical protein